MTSIVRFVCCVCGSRLLLSAGKRRTLRNETDGGKTSRGPPPSPLDVPPGFGQQYLAFKLMPGKEVRGYGDGGKGLKMESYCH